MYDLKAGDKVDIYFNLHKNCYSVKKKGKVVYHLYEDEELTLENVEFVVGKKGRERVLKEKRKNVHAYVRGIISDKKVKNSTEVSYDPYVADTFFLMRSYIQAAGKAAHMIYQAPSVLIKDGRVYI